MNLKIIILVSAICGFVLFIWFTNTPKTHTPANEIATTPVDDPQPQPPTAVIHQTEEPTKQTITMSTTPSREQPLFQEKELIQIAHERATKSAAIPDNVIPQITYKSDIAEIIWPIEWPKDTIFPRGDYHALVEIDRRSGKILKVLVSP